jgi:iron complex outermembrane receptor protein
LAALYQKDDGYIRDIARNDTVGSRENKTVRSKLRLDASDNVNFTVIGTYSDREDNTVISGYNLNGNSATGVANPTVPLAVRPNTTSQSFLPVNRVHQRGVSLRGEFDLGPATLSSISAYEYVWNYVRLDTDGSPVSAARFDSTSSAKALMQELNLASNGDNRLDWVTGIFIYDDNAKSDPYFFNTLPFNYATVKTRAYAAFGEINYQFTDRLNLIAGLRYSHEKKKLFSQGFPPFVTLPPQRDEQSWQDLAPRVSLRYELTPSSNVYATYSQGFKSGVYNAAVVGQPAVDPENVDAYEIGYKSSDLGGLALNIASYYYDYRDIQVSAYVAGSNTVNLLQNAASAEIYGIDGDLSGRIGNNLRIRLGGAWTHARYQDFKGAILLLPNPGGAGNRQISGDASGKRMIRQPEFTVNAGLDYETPLANGKLKMSGNVFVSGSYYWDPGNTIKEPSYTIANARASWTTPDQRWTFTVYSDNLFNEDYGIYVASSGRGNRKVNGRPRTVGLQASVNF